MTTLNPVQTHPLVWLYIYKRFFMEPSFQKHIFNEMEVEKDIFFKKIKKW